ncbi:MAG: MFS transporter [Clostridia bacterium]|nr:MFS transporter [Clostridia bacterium]
MRERLNFANKEKFRQKIGKTYLIACMAFYIICIAVKGVFAAETRYLIEIWDLTQAQVQLANTFYFITYGIVQILLFIFMAKIDIKKFTFVTIPISAILFIVMGLATNIQTMWILFALVGIFQASMFCATNYLLTKYLPRKLLPTANTLIASGYAIGTALSYVISAFFVGFDLWRVPYFLISGLVLISTVWLIYETKVIARFNKLNTKLDSKQMLTESKDRMQEKDLPLQNNQKPIVALSNRKRIVIFYVVILVLSLIVNGLYYGAMNFVTSILVDIYAFPQDASIYVSTIVPIIIILGPMITIKSCEKHQDFIKQGIKFLLIFLPFPILLTFFYKLNVILYIVLIIVFLILANGIRVIINNVIAFKMKDYINVASFTAITNAFASIAASAWPLIIALIKDNGSWGATYFTISIMAVVIFIAAIIIDRIVNATYKKDNNGENLE